jgi:hypothetical protein
MAYQMKNVFKGWLISLCLVIVFSLLFTAVFSVSVSAQKRKPKTPAKKITAAKTNKKKRAKIDFAESYPN